MNPGCAMIVAAAARLTARVAGMQAENARRESLGMAPAYSEAQFEALIDDEGLGYNAVIQTLRECA